jgi:hypothetical protein
MNKLKYLVLSALVVLVTACEVVKIVEPASGDVSPGEVNDVGFNLVGYSVLSTTISVRASWAKPASDGRGDPEYYLHTMTANKTVSGGTLPVRKKVTGLADTITINRPAVNDTIILTSQVWSVRRALESPNAATGRLVIRTADAAPPPPDTIIVDTIVLAPSIPSQGMSSIKTPALFVISSDTNNLLFNYNSLFIRKEDGATIMSDKNTTYITLVK